jgi:hypothetical protein
MSPSARFTVAENWLSLSAPGVIHRHWNFPDVDQFGFDIGAFRYFAENEIGHGFGQAPLPWSADNDRKENGSSRALHGYASICRGNLGKLTINGRAKSFLPSYHYLPAPEPMMIKS